MTIQNEQHKKTLRAKNRVIIALSLLLVLALVLLYLSQHIPRGNDLPSLIGPNDDSTALEQVKRFRRRLSIPKKSHGIYYDIADIQGYPHVFDSLITIQKNYQDTFHVGKPDRFPYGDYKWKVGFYWMMKKDKRTSTYKQDFYFVPSLVNIKDTTILLDYFEKNDTIYYHPPVNKSISSGSGNSYDEGQLWP